MKKATCTWGDGPDVLLSLEDDMFVPYEDPKHHAPPRGDYLHGYVTKGTMDLTADEALALAFELKAAAEQAKSFDRMCEEHDEAVKVPLSKEEMDVLNDYPLEDLTCHKCNQRDKCKYVDDLYNTDGNCLAEYTSYKQGDYAKTKRK